MSRTSLQLFMVAVFTATLLFGAIFASQPKTATAVAFCPCCGMYCRGPTSPCGGPGPGCTFVKCPICTDLQCQGQCLPGPGIPTQCDVVPGSCKKQPEKASPKGAKKAQKAAQQMKEDLLNKCRTEGGTLIQGSSNTGDPLGGLFCGTSTPPLAGFTSTTTSFADFFGSAGEQVSNIAADIFSSVFGGGGAATEEGGPSPEEVLGGGIEQEAGAEKETRAPPPILIIGRLRTATTGGGEDAVGISEEEAGVVTNILSRLFNIDNQADRSADRNAFFARLCIARPWQASFVARVFSSSFFDSLCVRQGYRSAISQGTFQTIFSEDPGRATLICPSKVPIGITATIQWGCAGSYSSGDGFDTGGDSIGSTTISPTDNATYVLSCANGGRASCFIEIGKPRVQLVAYPELVQLGARTRLFWTSEGVVDCTLEGPGLKERGIRGAATTPVIFNSVTYTISCVSEDNREARSSVIVGVGE